MTTFTQILATHDIDCPDQALADIEVPIFNGNQRQGDVGIWRRVGVGQAELGTFSPVPTDGLAIVRGETTGGNAHILQPANGVTYWQANNPTAGDILIGLLHVPEGATCYLIHTDEHGANGIAPGTYRITGKREMAEEVRRVAD